MNRLRVLCVLLMCASRWHGFDFDEVPHVTLSEVGECKEVAVDRIRVVVQASDIITEEGLKSCLAGYPDFRLLPIGQQATADVVVAAADRFTPAVSAALRRAARELGSPVVLVINELTKAELLDAVDCRVVAVLPRAAATGLQLLRAIRAAATGGGAMAPELIDEVLEHVERMRRDVLMQGVAELSAREVAVLRLVADGFDTEEVAQKLSYSTRTVKNVLFGLTSRLNLRNRPHAVAYAVRCGVI